MKGARAGPGSGIKSLAEGLNVRRSLATTECVAPSVDRMAGATTWEWLMERIRNRGRSKRGDENRHRAGGRISRTERFT